MKMKERFHAICRFLTMVSQGNHRVLFWLLGSAFAAATLPYLSLFFSARILNLLLAKSYRACLYTVVVFLLTQYGLGLFEKICRQYLDGQKELCLARTEQKITAKALELEFEKFEKTETMDAIRRTNVSSMGSGNVGDQLIVIHTLITSLLSVLYALFFLLRLFLLSDSSRNNFFTSPFSMLALLLLCGVQLALSSRINRRSTQKKIELNQGNDHSNSVANYLVNVMLEERRADDIRIGHLDHFLDVQFGKAMEHFLPMYLDFARFSAITDGKNALLSLLSNFAAYLVIGARALYGVLPIGDVLLYAGSVTRAMSDLQTFLATGSEFDYINSYLSTYEDFIAQPSMAYDGTLPIEKRDDGQYEFAFHDVSFSYPGTNIPVLEHVTLSFAVGEKTALVGRNGAGKTTLIKLLCRLYEPTSGYITLNGIDIRKYSYKSTRRHSPSFSRISTCFPSRSTKTSPPEPRLMKLLCNPLLQKSVSPTVYSNSRRASAPAFTTTTAPVSTFPAARPSAPPSPAPSTRMPRSSSSTSRPQPSTRSLRLKSTNSSAR